MDLSILICSLHQRADKLKRLLDLLSPQARPEVEILVESDNGEITVGRKRGLLLSRARGRYVAFVDDDDRVSNDYISRICEALRAKPDCVGIEGQVITAPGTVLKLLQSRHYRVWNRRKGVVRRMPNHLNPVRAELAREIGFADVSSGEDRDYSVRLYPLLKTEVRMSGPVYFYEYSITESATCQQPPGLLYRNTFGCDFELSIRLNNPQKAPLSCRIDGQLIQLSVSCTGEHIHVNRDRADHGLVVVSLTHNNLARLTGPLTRFEILEGHMQSLTLPPSFCEVGGRVLRNP